MINEESGTAYEQDSADPALANSGPSLRQRQDRIWPESKRQTNITAIGVASGAPLLMKLLLVMRDSHEVGGLEGIFGALVFLMGLGALWAIAHIIHTFSEWTSISTWLVVAGAMVMVCSWLYFGAHVPSILVGGFTMLGGIILKAKS